jgi:hypothetical protein
MHLYPVEHPPWETKLGPTGHGLRQMPQVSPPVKQIVPSVQSSSLLHSPPSVPWGLGPGMAPLQPIVDAAFSAVAMQLSTESVDGAVSPGPEPVAELVSTGIRSVPVDELVSPEMSEFELESKMSGLSLFVSSEQPKNNNPMVSNLIVTFFIFFSFIIFYFTKVISDKKAYSYNW